MIENNNEIEVYYDNQKERIKIVLDNRERFIRNFKDKKLDYTVVEILLKDNIDKKYFLLPNLDYNTDNYKSLNNKKIFIVQFPEGNKLSHSSGNIIKIENYELAHKVSTEPGSSGSPIFLIETTKVIGIHKSGDKYIKENYGDFIFPIIKILDKINHKDKFNNYNKTKVKKKHVNYASSYSKINDDSFLIDYLVEYILIKDFEIPPYLLYPKANVTKWGIGEKRGGFDYYPPIGWLGIGLNVLGKYDNGNNDWLNYNGGEKEWAIAYHGTNRKNIKSILIDGLKCGPNQFHRDSRDIYHPNKKIGIGIYATPSPRLMEQYAEMNSFTFNGKKVLCALMVRVKPDKIRCPSENPDYWILNPTIDEIRPYRILLKYKI